MNYGPLPAGPGAGANQAIAVPANAPAPMKQAYNGDAKDPLARDWGPSSVNKGGIIIHGMGDGSVREVSDTGDRVACLFQRDHDARRRSHRQLRRLS